MKHLQIQIPDDYADVLTVTCIGTKENVTNITVEAFDIRKTEDNTLLIVRGERKETK